MKYYRRKHMWYYPLAKPKTKPVETLDTSGMPIFDIVPGWLAPIVLETCVNASATRVNSIL